MTAESLLQSVRRLESQIRSGASDAERERRLSASVVDAMRDAGFFRLWRPQAFGGLETDPVTACQTVEAVSRIDSAAGWNMQIGNAVDLFGPWFSDPGASEIFGSPDVILGGGLNPPRTAVPTDGGYRVSGQTPFVSGAHQCDWVFGLAVVMDGDEPRRHPNGQPQVLIHACPARDIQILDTWHTMGMRGTGSHDVVATDLFLPERWTTPLAPLGEPGSAYGGPLYRLTIWPLVAALAAPALGSARAAIDALVLLATSKTPAYTARTLRDRDLAQAQVARAEARLGAARAYLYDALGKGWSRALAGDRLSQEDKVELQLATIHAIDGSVEAVDLVYEAAGSSGFREEQPFERCFRDVHVMAQHAFTSHSRYESVGQLLFGLDSDWPFFAM